MTSKREKAASLWVRIGDCLRPLDGVSAAILARFPERVPLKGLLTQARSVPQNRLYWSLLNKVVENLDAPIEAEDLHEWLKDRLGYGELVPVGNTKIRRSNSTAFDKMSQPEFRRYFDAAKALIVEHIIPGLDAPALEREAAAMLGDDWKRAA